MTDKPAKKEATAPKITPLDPLLHLEKDGCMICAAGPPKKGGARIYWPDIQWASYCCRKCVAQMVRAVNA